MAHMKENQFYMNDKEIRNISSTMRSHSYNGNSHYNRTSLLWLPRLECYIAIMVTAELYTNISTLLYYRIFVQMLIYNNDVPLYIYFS